MSIYRLISEGTVEENIMKKAMRKRELDRVAIQSAMFDSFHGKEGMRFFNPCVFEFISVFRGCASERKYQFVGCSTRA